MFEVLCSEVESTSQRGISYIGLMGEVIAQSLKVSIVIFSSSFSLCFFVCLFILITASFLKLYLLEVEGNRLENTRSGIFLWVLEKYRRCRDRCREMREHIRSDPRNRDLVEELATL